MQLLVDAAVRPREPPHVRPIRVHLSACEALRVEEGLRRFLSPMLGLVLGDVTACVAHDAVDQVGARAVRKSHQVDQPAVVVAPRLPHGRWPKRRQRKQPCRSRRCEWPEEHDVESNVNEQPVLVFDKSLVSRHELHTASLVGQVEVNAHSPLTKAAVEWRAAQLVADLLLFGSTIADNFATDKAMRLIEVAC